jgi:thymidine kinase
MAKLHFYYSAMNAGKSTTLLQSSHNYNERGMQTLLLIPAIDDRAGVGTISTRVGLSAKAEVVGSDSDLLQIAKKARDERGICCVLVDEAQFLSKSQVVALAQVVDTLGIPVLCYGIRSDFRGEPFPGSKYLLSWADNISEIKTICHCGRKATMNMRIDAEGRPVHEGDQVEIGGNDRYISTCRRHFDLEASLGAVAKESSAGTCC